MKRNRSFSPHKRSDNRSKDGQRRPAQRGYPQIETSFRCVHCGALVTTDPRIAGVLNRNHCPYCLWSRHVDLYEAGDRLCACKAPMQPIGLTIKQTHKKYAREDSGELMLIHACAECDRLSINRIAADDLTDVLLAIFDESIHTTDMIRERLASQQIRLLVEADRELVRLRLFGLEN